MFSTNFGEAQRYHFTGEEKERVSPKEATLLVFAATLLLPWPSTDRTTRWPPRLW